jgi:hypothetical protein
MMPSALRAGFHHISRILVLSALQFHNVAPVGHTFAVLWQSMPKYVGHECHMDLFADRAQGLGGLANIASGSNEFRMGVTYRVFTYPATLHFVDERATRKLMINYSSAAAQHVHRETHYATS